MARLLEVPSLKAYLKELAQFYQVRSHKNDHPVWLLLADKFGNEHSLLLCSLLWQHRQAQLILREGEVIDCFMVHNVTYDLANTFYDMTNHLLQFSWNECSLECTSLIIAGLQDPSDSCDWPVTL